MNRLKFLIIRTLVNLIIGLGRKVSWFNQRLIAFNQWGIAHMEKYVETLND